MKKEGIGWSFLNIIPFLIVLALSLALLIYVGIGDANRVYPKFYIDKIESIGEIVQNSINSYLLSGLPLKQYVGFTNLSSSLLKTEEAIQRMEVIDENDNTIFENSQISSDLFDIYSSSYTIDKYIDKENIFSNYDYYKIVLPIENKFETVGYLNIYPLKSIPQEMITEKFSIILYVSLGIVAFFAILMTILFRKVGKKTKFGVQILYIISFLILAGYIMFLLFNLYGEGIRDRTQAMANSLSQRLNEAIDLNLELSDFTGIEEVFNDYKDINTDISYISLAEKNQILIHTEDSLIDTARSERPDFFEEPIHLEGNFELTISVGIPKDIITAQLFRSGKNFLVLLLASAFLAILFLNLLMSVKKAKDVDSENVDRNSIDSETLRELKLDLVRPLYFLAIFLEGLFVSFLPSFFKNVAANANLDTSFTSILFTIYFAAFVISLIPSGRIAEKGKIKGLMVVGIILFSISYAVLAFIELGIIPGSISFYTIIVSRVFAGIGQGMVFISVQSYILKISSKEKKTKGTSIIVFGYNGGMIAGTAIGALLVSYVYESGIFIIAGFIGILIFLYTVIFIPKIKLRAVERVTVNKQRFLKNIGKVFKDFEFIKTILLVGIITKAILTGVNKYALPLILGDNGYIKEDIGQILIFYSIAVLISTMYVSRKKDKIGKSSSFLFLGTEIGGIGLYIIGLMNWDVLKFIPVPNIDAIFIILGLFILGFAHGFIHAPIVTHISETKVANKIGISSTTSLYRFLERIGHVSGPIIVSQLLYAMAGSALVISWIGVVTLVSGVLFIIFRSKRKPVEAV